MSGVARNEERPDGARLWGVLAAILQMAILILFLLLLRGCGGGEAFAYAADPVRAGTWTSSP